MSWLFASGGQSIGALVAASVLAIDWFDLLAVQGTLKSFSNTTVQKHQFFSVQLFLLVQFSHPYMATEKIIALTRWTLLVMSLLFDMLFMDFPGGSDSKASIYNVGDLDSIPGLGRSPGEGNGNPPQYSCLENPMDRRAWQAT